VLFLGIGFSVLGTDLGITGIINLAKYRLPIIRATSQTDQTSFKSLTYRDKIKTITLDDEILPPDNVVASWDISEARNGNVMAYVTPNEDDNTKYDLYIQGNGHLYANEDSSYLFYNLRGVDAIYGIDKLDISLTTNMASMFSYVGCNSSVFALDLGNNFDTSNVTDMSGMFDNTGYGSASFTLNLGDKFDTGNVTDMNKMFNYTGYSSSIFTLDLGNDFDTNNVTDMSYMFDSTGYNSTLFVLDLEDKFDTSNVMDMSYMFYGTGFRSPSFTLDLGDKFDTSQVNNMSHMFNLTGRNSTVFTLNLGNLFNTSNVTNMSTMFSATGYKSTILTLNLGDKFDTSKVQNMNYMFSSLGYNNTAFTLDLGDKFDTSKVTNMSFMFSYTGYNTIGFTLDLGNKFDTNNVTNMDGMFKNSLNLTTIYAPSSFVTTNVQSSDNMFDGDISLVGGMGTVYDNNVIDKTYAHIDEGVLNQGYFTDVNISLKKKEIKKTSNIGKRVSFLSNYSSDLIWRLLYADDDYVYLISSKLYDDNGDVYEIEAQRTNYGGLGGVGLISQQNTSYSGSEDITDPFLRSLNSKWYEYLENEENAEFRTTENAKSIAWFMDQSRWSNWKDSAGVAKYAIGGPPIEVFIKSYNLTAPSNSQSPISLSIVNGGYEQNPESGDMLLNTYNYGIYHLRGEIDAFWLSSPGGDNGSNPGSTIRTSGGNNYRKYGIYFGYSYYNLGLRPVVILPIDDYVLSSYDIIDE